MKFAKIFSVIFAVLAVVLIALTAVGYVSFHREPPMIGTPVDEADSAAESLAEAVCRMDYAAASDILYGNPELQWDEETATPLGTRLWQAYAGSMSYEFNGPCYATADGIFRDVTFTALDISALEPKIQERFDLLMEPYLAESKHNYEIYDENGVMRQDFTENILYQAVDEILLEDNARTDYQITLELVFQDGKWLVVPNQTLIDIIAGVMTK
ncbi:MAG: hypothetical protein IJO77_00725 [Oscillospiraceae bacterium]|nr:hypothetical protein [Oscillospiraceae bacterium]